MRISFLDITWIDAATSQSCILPRSEVSEQHFRGNSQRDVILRKGSEFEWVREERSETDELNNSLSEGFTESWRVWILHLGQSETQRNMVLGSIYSITTDQHSRMVGPIWCGPATSLFSSSNLSSLQLQDLPLEALVRIVLNFQVWRRSLIQCSMNS